jgi:hypothetical protein
LEIVVEQPVSLLVDSKNKKRNRKILMIVRDVVGCPAYLDKKGAGNAASNGRGEGYLIIAAITFGAFNFGSKIEYISQSFTNQLIF